MRRFLKAPDLPSLNLGSFISAMNHPSFPLLCYCFQIPWPYFCKPRSGPLRSFPQATHCLFLLSPVPPSPDITPSPHPVYSCLNLLCCRALFLSFSLPANNCFRPRLASCRDEDEQTCSACLLCAGHCSKHFT